MSAARRGTVRVSEVAFRYPNTPLPVLNGLNFEITAGEIFGILGPNGAGKTTLISLLCTLRLPQHGVVEVAGYDAMRDSPLIRPHIGYVPQDIALYPNLTILENMHYFGTLAGVPTKSLPQRIAAALQAVGLEEPQHRLVRNCSGGMKRRANIAVSLLHQPAILILDEPTVGVDPQSRALILHSLAKLGEQGTTILYTTHYMEEAQQLCKRVMIMDHGKSIACGSPEALIREHNGATSLEDVFLQRTGRGLREA